VPELPTPSTEYRIFATHQPENVSEAVAPLNVEGIVFSGLRDGDGKCEAARGLVDAVVQFLRRMASYNIPQQPTFSSVVQFVISGFSMGPPYILAVTAAFIGICEAVIAIAVLGEVKDWLNNLADMVESHTEEIVCQFINAYDGSQARQGAIDTLLEHGLDDVQENMLRLILNSWMMAQLFYDGNAQDFSGYTDPCNCSDCFYQITYGEGPAYPGGLFSSELVNGTNHTVRMNFAAASCAPDILVTIQEPTWNGPEPAVWQANYFDTSGNLQTPDWKDGPFPVEVQIKFDGHLWITNGVSNQGTPFEVTITYEDGQ
jgi:hypothetical protein